MRSGGTLYHCVARDELNNLESTKLGSVPPLWSNLPVSDIRQGISSTANDNFLSFHATETNLMPWRS